MTLGILDVDTRAGQDCGSSHPSEDNQYSLLKILTIWALVTIPMPIMAFIVAPAITTPGTVGALLTVWYLMIAGMIWQFILSVIILYRELDSFSWSAIKERIWLQAPRDPRTGKTNYKLFWWLIPAFLFYLAFEVSPIGAYLGELILIPLPILDQLPVLDLSDLAVPELKGAWWLVGVGLFSCTFNYLLGEELLFRGILLPKMRGTFGRWDFVANSVLFALYHLHRPTQMLGFIISGIAWTLPVKLFRSIWFSVILHGFEGIFVIVGTLAIAAGVAL